MENDLRNYLDGTKKEIQKSLMLAVDKSHMMAMESMQCEYAAVNSEFWGLYYDVDYFKTLVDVNWPLEDRISEYMNDPGSNNVKNIKVEDRIRRFDLNTRKSFLAIIQFSQERLLDVIIREYGIDVRDLIDIDKKVRVTLSKKYEGVMTYFGIPFDEYRCALNAYHYVRNTLHAGTESEWAFERCTHNGTVLEVERGGTIEFGSWRYLIWLTVEVLDIYYRIINSPNFKTDNYRQSP